MAANALVVQFPTWSFEPTRHVERRFDRMFGPGIAWIFPIRPSKTAAGSIQCITGHLDLWSPRWQETRWA